jgi:hypothetical protein
MLTLPCKPVNLRYRIRTGRKESRHSVGMRETIRVWLHRWLHSWASSRLSCPLFHNSSHIAIGSAPDQVPATAAAPEHQEPTPEEPTVEVQLEDGGDYHYVGPPNITKGVYVEVICSHAGDSEICTAAPAMYDTLIAAGIDPAAELAHLNNESSYGTGGVGMRPWRNPHGVHGVPGAQWGTPFYNGVEGDEVMQ